MQSYSNSIIVGSSPYGVAVNPRSNLVYVTNYKSDTVSVVNGTSHVVMGSISVGKSPTHISC